MSRICSWMFTTAESKLFWLLWRELSMLLSLFTSGSMLPVIALRINRAISAMVSASSVARAGLVGVLFGELGLLLFFRRAFGC